MPALVPYACRTAIVVAQLLGSAMTARGDVGLATTPGGGPARHIHALQDIASAHGGNRAAGTPGYDLSARYVADQLRDAGYKVHLEEFTFPFFEERASPVLVSGVTDQNSYSPASEAVRTLRNSGSGDVTARLQAVDLGSDDAAPQVATSGCEREDFAGFAPGSIALIRRGTCPFQLKVEHAQAAGAAGVVIMNQGSEGRTGTFSGQLSVPAAIPVLGVTTEVGHRLSAASQRESSTLVRLRVEAETGLRSTRNVIAEKGAMSGSFAVVGAHLDSVSEGPGVNDNASGVAAVLEAALRLTKAPAPGVPVRFAFWGAEERGLLGSRHHLSILPEEEGKRIALYINLDMVGSPNFGRFIQLSQGNKAGLAESTVSALNRYFEGRGLPLDEQTGRPRGFGSDDASFAARDIPTLSLFTGAGETKSEAQAERFGGSASKPFDPCYHKACDTAANINEQVLEQITDALAHALDELAIR